MKKSIKILSFFVAMIMAFSSFSDVVRADGLIQELFGFSFYYFHYIDENGREQTQSTYNWGSATEEENGIKITKTDLDSIRLEIDADSCELYNQTMPVLIWVHKADGLFDVTKYTDIDLWYSNKLSETFLLQQVEYTGSDVSLEIRVPMKLNLGMTGIINGGYYEVEFYTEDAIPDELRFAYDMQTYSLEELEEYIAVEMEENIDDYYNVDSGFRPETDGFAFANTDFTLNGGVCSGIAAVTTAKYNGYSLDTEFRYDDENYIIDETVSWYENVFGSESIHDTAFDSTLTDFRYNYPSLYPINSTTSTAFPLSTFDSFNSDNKMLGAYLNYYKYKNNAAVILGGNSYVGSLALANLQNRWSIIDYVASYLRQGKAVTVNISTASGGHAIVGYKMEKIDEDTYRLYCYDNNYPDDYCKYFIEGNPQNYDLNSDGSYKNIVWQEREVYIDITKITKRAYADADTYKEIDVFEFDSSNTSVAASSSTGGQITFTLCKGDSIGTFNYGNETNEVVAYKAYPVIKDDKTVELRTFAFYQSGEAREITHCQYTNVKMDYSYIGYYKIKDSQIILTKDSAVFDDEGNSYIEAYVSYDNNKDSFGQIKVRIPVTIS